MKRYPIELQDEQKACGVFCILMILKYYGFKDEISHIKEKTRMNQNGVSIKGIIECLKSYQIEAKAYEATLEEVDRENMYPSILFMVYDGIGHFVVLYEQYDDYLIIDGTTTYTKQNCEIDCEESGSTLRFMVPISIVCSNKVHFTGRGNLGKRPLDTYYEIFDEQNIGYLYKQDILDLYINGKLKPDCFKIPGNISSQFITGLLFALPLLDGDSTIKITSYSL